jgi:hypothetical protein
VVDIDTPRSFFALRRLAIAVTTGTTLAAGRCDYLEVDGGQPAKFGVTEIAS